MKATRAQRRVAMVMGASALVGMGIVTACSPREKPSEPPSSSSNPSATAPASPTEKSVPGVVAPGAHSGSGPQNSFSPTVTARPAPTALPGNVITGG